MRREIHGLKRFLFFFITMRAKGDLASVGIEEN